MIVAVKRKEYKKKILKFISFIAVVVMFIWYYFHMSETFSNYTSKQEKYTNKPISLKSQKIENIIYQEARIVVDLIGQINVDKIKILNKKLFLVCDPNTNLEPLMVRYGVVALIKRSVKDIKIAIDLKTIVESNI